MRLTGNSADGTEFDASRAVEAPILLAIPFGILGGTTICVGWQWVWQRFTGSFLLISISVACTLSALRKCQTRLRLESRAGLHSSADNNSFFELRRCESLDLATNRFQYATHLVNQSGTRQVLLQSRLPTQLNAIRRLQKQWQMGVRAGVLLPEIFSKILREETDLRISGKSNALLKSPLRDQQLGTASIMFAVSLLALVVVTFLLTGQLEIRGPVTSLGLSLGFLLAAVPLTIGIHLVLGRVRLRIESGRLRLERRRGVLGTKAILIPLSEIKGVWLIRTDEARISELLILSKGSFHSVPVTHSAWPNWQAVFGQIDSSGQAVSTS